MMAEFTDNHIEQSEASKGQHKASGTFLYPVHKNPKAISGGFVIKARKIDESEIAHAAPCIREIWDWLLRQCNHKDNNTLGIKRGQCVRRLADMMEGLHWYVGYRKMTYSKSQCEHACEWLRERGMITTAKTTRGMLITVCNYDSYNRIENYEANNEKPTKATRSQQQADTINKNDKNVNNESLVGGYPPKQKTYKEWTIEEFKEEISNTRDVLLGTDEENRSILNNFYRYWSEKNPKGKMKFQLQQTWETKLRLISWAKREFEPKK